MEEKESAWRQDKLRPELEKVLRMARLARVPVYLWDYDRLYRNRKNTVSTVKEYAKAGVPIKSYRQKWMEEILTIPSPWNEIIYDMLLQVVAWMGEEESQKKSERIKAAYKRLKKSKKHYPWGRRQCQIDTATILEMRKQRLSLRWIASHFNVDPCTIRNRLLEAKKHGIGNNNENGQV